MRAWQFTNTHAPLRRAEVPEPIAGVGDVVIDVRAAGLCHSDVGLMEDEGWLSMLAKRPITIGHEVAGVISALGEGVQGWTIGDRVGVCPTTPAGAPGYGYDGGYADRVRVAAQTLVRIPENVSLGLGAVGTDAGMTSHHAIMSTGGLRAGMKLGIIGLGGLGQIGARVGVLAGAQVYVAEIDRRAWALGEALGVKRMATSITEFASEELDLIVDLAGFGTTTAQAIETVRNGGRVVQVGMGRLEANISTKALILKRVTLVGSAGGTIEDVEGIYRYFATGQLAPALTYIGFDDIPDGLERLRRGEVTGRLVAKLGD
jgi:propanol-preferring alcohol dehydrogenase